jgi:hypothetical protein
MTQAQINRRRALAVVAAVPAVAALGGSAFTMGEPGELAALVRRYFEECEAFNQTGPDPITGEWRSDEESDALAAVTFDKTGRELIGVPARTTEDALAALEWLAKEGADLDELNWGDWSPHANIVASLVDAIRGYIEGRAA